MEDADAVAVIAPGLVEDVRLGSTWCGLGAETPPKANVSTSIAI